MSSVATSPAASVIEHGGRSPLAEMDPEIGRRSFKVINPKFLLKYDE